MSAGSGARVGKTDKETERCVAQHVRSPHPDTRLPETVLVIDDEEIVRHVASTVLTTHGVHVLAAASGQEALALPADDLSRVRAVLLDVLMPQMDGVEVRSQIRKTHPRVPVVFMSGTPPDAELQSILQTDPLTSFLQKPFRPDQIREALSLTRIGPVEPAASPSP